MRVDDRTTRKIDEKRARKAVRGNVFLFSPLSLSLSFSPFGGTARSSLKNSTDDAVCYVGNFLPFFLLPPPPVSP